jgi:hypothetical protein
MNEFAEEPAGMNPKLKEAHQHFHAARKAMGKSCEAWLPPGFLDNRRTARREFLLGIRCLLDKALEATAEAEKPVKEKKG